MLDGHVIDKVFCRRREDQAADAVDGHQHEPEYEQAAPRIDQGPDVGKRLPLAFDFLRFCASVGFRVGCHRLRPDATIFLGCAWKKVEYISNLCSNKDGRWLIRTRKTLEER